MYLAMHKHYGAVGAKHYYEPGCAIIDSSLISSLNKVGCLTTLGSVLITQGKQSKQFTNSHKYIPQGIRLTLI